MNMRFKLLISICLVMFLSNLFFTVGCRQNSDTSPPDKVIPSVSSLFSQLRDTGGESSTTPDNGVLSEECQGIGELSGIIVDPYDSVYESDLGTGSFDLSGCGWQASGQSISTVEDYDDGTWFVAAIGDFYNLSDSFVIVQVYNPMSSAEPEFVIDGFSTGVFVVDSNFENLWAYAESGMISFSQTGRQ
jgi:hypothetical protein